MIKTPQEIQSFKENNKFQKVFNFEDSKPKFNELRDVEAKLKKETKKKYKKREVPEIFSLKGIDQRNENIKEIKKSRFEGESKAEKCLQESILSSSDTEQETDDSQGCINPTDGKRRGSNIRQLLVSEPPSSTVYSSQQSGEIHLNAGKIIKLKGTSRRFLQQSEFSSSKSSNKLIKSSKNGSMKNTKNKKQSHLKNAIQQIEDSHCESLPSSSESESNSASNSIEGDSSDTSSFSEEYLVPQNHQNKKPIIKNENYKEDEHSLGGNQLTNKSRKQKSNTQNSKSIPSGTFKSKNHEFQKTDERKQKKSSKEKEKEFRVYTNHLTKKLEMRSLRNLNFLKKSPKVVKEDNTPCGHQNEFGVFPKLLKQSSLVLDELENKLAKFNDQCAICSQILNNNTILASDNLCNHLYHEECLVEYLLSGEKTGDEPFICLICASGNALFQTNIE